MNENHLNLKKDFIAIDVETAQGKRWSICQIGLTIVEGGEVKQTITRLIQPPENKYLPGNIHVHGITSDKTVDMPNFPVIWEKIYPIIENKKLVAHNAKFDQNCLEQTLGFYDLPVPDFDFDCTLNLSGYKLDDACLHYNIDLNNHHDAGCDAEACAQLYLNILRGEKPNYSKGKTNQYKVPPAYYEGHEQLCGDVLKKDLENADINSPFYNKKVVFTGVLKSIDRKEAALIVKNMGADIDTSITKRINYVVAGSAAGPRKVQLINKYNEQGCNIQVLFEDEFVKMINK